MAKREIRSGEREAPWMQKAAEAIVREQKTPWQAFNDQGLECTSNEAEELMKGKTFQKVLWAERQRYSREIATTPGRDKLSALGLMMQLCQKLIDDGQFDKAANVLEKIMKAEGWTQPENQTNIYAGLTPNDLAQLRAELADEKSRSRKGTTEETVQ